MSNHIGHVTVDMAPEELLNVICAGGAAASWVREMALGDFWRSVEAKVPADEREWDSKEALYAALGQFDMLMQKFAMQVESAITGIPALPVHDLQGLIDALEKTLNG